MTKAEKILRLSKRGKTTREIAQAVFKIVDDAPYVEWDKRMAYVRVVIGQRNGSSMSENDTRYQSSPRGRLLNTIKAGRYREKHRDKYNAYQRDYKRKQREKALQDA